MVRMSETGPVCLVSLVYLVYLVCLVDLVHLVSFVQPNKPDKRNKPNNGLLTLADFFSILLDFPMPLRQERSELLGRRLSAAEP